MTHLARPAAVRFGYWSKDQRWTRKSQAELYRQGCRNCLGTVSNIAENVDGPADPLFVRKPHLRCLYRELTAAKRAAITLDGPDYAYHHIKRHSLCARAGFLFCNMFYRS